MKWLKAIAETLIAAVVMSVGYGLMAIAICLAVAIFIIILIFIYGFCQGNQLATWAFNLAFLISAIALFRSKRVRAEAKKIWEQMRLGL